MRISTLKKVALVCVAILFAGGLTRAALKKYEQKREEIRLAAQQERSRLGLSGEALKKKYPTPEIGFVSCVTIAPGGTGQLVVKGKFQPGTRFVIPSDNIEVVGENVTATEYRATIRALPGAGPESVRIEAFAPVSGIPNSTEPAVFIGGRFVWEMKTDNGWRIIAANATDDRCQGGRGRAGQLEFKIDFYKGAETKPFASGIATLYHEEYSGTYNFSIQQEVAGSPEAKMKQYAEKMQDPNLSNAERERIMAEFQKMMAEMSNLEAIQKQAQQAEATKAEFGCESISLKPQAGGGFAGEMRCSPKVGRQIKVTATLKILS